MQTFTIQSAFKYDYPVKQVIEAIEYINKTERGKPFKIDEDTALKYIDIIHKDYADTIKEIAPLVNDFSQYIPGRRKRKMHIGLFGYSRNASGIKLPRTITFCGRYTLWGYHRNYSSFSELTEEDITKIKACYTNFEYDIKEALQYLNEKNLDLLPFRIKEKNIQDRKNVWI